MKEAYPLHWPVGFQRTKNRARSKFKSLYGGASAALVNQIRMLGGKNMILSTNIPIRNDGLPYADAARRRIDDPGAAVYFELKGEQRSIACDKWDRVEDNVRALALTIDAMRGMDRWGCSEMLDRVFRGFAALPAPSYSKQWWEILDCPQNAPIETIEEKYRRLAKTAHPDLGGSPEKMSELNAAIEQARSANL